MSGREQKVSEQSLSVFRLIIFNKAYKISGELFVPTVI